MSLEKYPADPRNHLNPALFPSLLGSLWRRGGGGGGEPSSPFDGILPAGATFTRASDGTYWDDAGVLQTAAVDAPRYSYDPATLDPVGLHLEPARTRLNTQAACRGWTGWTLSGITASTDVGLDGTTQSIVLTATADNATATLAIASAAAEHVFSLWGKRLAVPHEFGGAGVHQAWLSLDGGTTEWPIGQFFQDGLWRRVWRHQVGTNPTLRIRIEKSGDVFRFDCKQVEAGSWPSSEIINASGARAADVVTLPIGGTLDHDTVVADVPHVGLWGMYMVNLITDFGFRNDVWETDGEEWETDGEVWTDIGLTPEIFVRYAEHRWPLGGNDYRDQLEVVVGLGPPPTYYVRPGPEDLDPYTGGTGDGSSYENAFRGLDDPGIKALINQPGAMIIDIAGEHAPIGAIQGDVQNAIPVRGGKSHALPKLFRGNADDPPIIWGGRINTLSGFWADTGGNVWVSDPTQSSLDQDSTPAYLWFFDGATRRTLTRRATLAECQTDEDSWFCTTPANGGTLYVHLRNGETATDHIMIPQMGHKFQLYGAYTIDYLWMYNIDIRWTTRASPVPAAGIARNWASNVKMRHCRHLYGGGQIFNLYMANDWDIAESELAYTSNRGLLYTYYAEYDNDGVDTDLDPGGKRQPKYQCNRFRLVNLYAHHTGYHIWNNVVDLDDGIDTQGLAFQGGNDHVISGCYMYRHYKAIVNWPSDNPESEGYNFRVEFTFIHDSHEGASLDMSSDNTVPLCIRISNNEAPDHYTGGEIYSNLVQGWAPIGVDPPTLRPNAYRLGRTKPSNITAVRYCGTIDYPGGLFMSSGHLYFDAQYCFTINPTGFAAGNTLGVVVSAGKGKTIRENNYYVSDTLTAANCFIAGFYPNEVIRSLAEVQDPDGSYAQDGSSSFDLAE